MSCPCEVLVDDCPERTAREVLQIAATEALRIERKFSRYREDNIVHQINTAEGRTVDLDDETSRLIDFAANLTAASEGAFDLTSGILRKAWRFDGGDQVPDESTIRELMTRAGWNRVEWDRPRLTLEPGMQIDFGGIGKEYAVDRAVRLLAAAQPGLGVLVNLGGDLAIGGVRVANRPWTVGIESTRRPDEAIQTVPVRAGGLATSGDSRRFVLRDGRRFSHVLDARTGWPVANAPHSITVLGRTCTEAGTLTTLALLKGSDAQPFLTATGSRFWLQ